MRARKSKNNKGKMSTKKEKEDEEGRLVTEEGKGG